jgi:methenyltetrahydrofolate cyclohydrolase
LSAAPGNPLIDRPLRALLDEVASATPAPGGGACAGWACALAASLVEMAAAFATERAGAERARMLEISARAHSLRERATALAQADLHAYVPVLRALQMPKDDPERAAQLDVALSDAAETPLAIARAAAEVSALALEVSRGGSPHLRGDALAGLHLAEGACQAAARLVEINLAGRPDDERLKELATLVERAAADRASSGGRSPA